MYAVLIHLGRAVEFPSLNERIQIADLWFVALGILWLWRRGWPFFSFLGREPWFVVLPLAFVFSLVHTVNMSKSLIALAGLVYVVLLYHCVTQVLTSKQQMVLFLTIWVVSSAILFCASLGSAMTFWIGGDASHSILSLYHHDPRAFDFPRIQGWFQSPTMYVSVMHVTLVFAAILLPATGRGIRTAIGIFIVVLLVHSLLTLSHGIAGLFLTAFLIALRGGGGTKWSAAKYVLGVACAGILVLYVLSVLFRIYPIHLETDRADQTVSIGISYAPSIYTVQYGAAISMGLEHPVIGQGIGTFRMLVSNYIDWNNAAPAFSSHSRPAQGYFWKPSYDPHNTYLGAFAEGGLLGFTAVVGVLLVISVRLIRFVRHSVDPFGGWCGWCVFAGYIGFLLNAFTMDMLLFRHLWVMLAVGAVAIRMAESTTHE